MPRRPAMPDKHTNSPPPSISSIALLRQQWKWAAFSLFFYTFSPLFAMSDVTLNVSFNSRCSLSLYSYHFTGYRKRFNRRDE